VVLQVQHHTSDLFRRNTMLRQLSLATLAGSVILLLGCSGGPSASDQARDSLTRRQKDSIIATLPIPGAKGVGKALDALEKSNARAAQHDSLALGR
jgi:hypothetical protein